MTFKEASSAIDRWSVRAIKPGLSRTKQLLKISGYPDRFFPVVQVAGTNGKGSVTAMLSSILTAAGYKTGRFTSPHLIEECERIAINNQQISKKQFIAGVLKLLPALKVAANNGKPVTTFEAWTVLAAIIFKEQKIDIAVVETGLGGRFDATTAFSKKILTCITNIHLDHTAILGKTKSAICFEKMGITRKGIPLLSSESNLLIRKQIKQLAVERNVPVYFCGHQKKDSITIISSKAMNPGIEVTLVSGRMPKEIYHTTLNGVFQQYNLALAVMAANWLTVFGWSVEQKAIQSGLMKVQWPGRLEKLTTKPAIFLDGAHNPEAIKAVIKAIQPKIKKLNVIIGMMKDKAVEQCVGLLSPWIKKAYVFTPNDMERGLKAEDLAKMFIKRKTKVIAFNKMSEAIKVCIESSNKSDKILIIGSLYNIKEAKATIGRIIL